MKSHSFGTSILGAFLAMLVLASCGGGGGGGGSTSHTTAPSDLQYSSPPAYVVQQAITPLTPTVVGQVSGYSVSPALPTGLSINASSGVISGTPTAVAGQQNYVVTATNGGGSTTATVSIVVNDVGPTVAYSSPYYGFTANVATDSISPTLGGGTVVNWSVSPALPAGLTLDSSSGDITGIPTAASAPAAYTITASNSGGQVTADLTISVAAAPLMNLGHSQSVGLLRTTATDVLSFDLAGHWVLQNYASGTMLASGDSPCVNPAADPCFAFDNQGRTTFGSAVFYPADIAAGTMIDLISSGVEIRSSVDGHVLGTAAGQFSWYRLASDGSYVCTGSSSALVAWSTSGQVLVSHAGNYSAAKVFCAPGAMLAAVGPAGSALIENVSVPSGTASVSPSFQGQFQAWFADGSSFLSLQGDVAWTYSSAAVQEDQTQLPLSGPSNLGGVGNWFWICGGAYVYKVGSSTSPAFTESGASNCAGGGVVSQQTLGGVTFATSPGQIGVLDLSGTSIVETTCQTGVFGGSYAWVPGASCVVGNSNGVILDGASSANQPRFLANGAVVGMAGGAAYVSVATASGEIFTFDSTSNALVSTIDFPAHQLSMSSSGTVLAALANSPVVGSSQFNTTLNVYSLPSGSVLNTFPSSLNIGSMSLSASGTVLGQMFSATSGGCDAETVLVTGGAPTWCDTTGTTQYLQISPDGTLVSATTDTFGQLGGPAWSTNLFNNGTLVTALPGRSIGWLDNSRVLVNNYIQEKYSTEFNGTTIYSASGTAIATPPAALPEMHIIQPLTSNSIYSPEFNAIFSLTTGAPSWSSGNTATLANLNVVSGAVAGSQVFFQSGALLLAQSY